jgi:hypothetical protein
MSLRPQNTLPSAGMALGRLGEKGFNHERRYIERVQIIHFIDLRKTPRTTYIGTKHTTKKMGSPIVNRRSCPQTAQALMVRMTMCPVYQCEIMGEARFPHLPQR